MKKLYILSICLSIFYSSNLYGQRLGPPSAENDKGWLTAGIGVGLQHDFSSVINVNYGSVHVVQFAYHNSFDFSIGNDPLRFNSISLNYCFSSYSRFTRVAFSLGPSYVYGKREVEYPHKSKYFKSVGILINCQAILTPLTEFGLGWDFYLNINPEQTVGGVALTFVIEGNK